MLIVLNSFWWLGLAPLVESSANDAAAVRGVRNQAGFHR